MSNTRSYDIRLETNANPAAKLLGDYAFTNTPVPPPKEEKSPQDTNTDKVFFSYLNNEAVAKVAILPMQMNVRSKVMDMGGISGVASMPIARRGGHIRALLERSIEQMREDGQAVSTLYPFKAAYYENFGYSQWQAPLWFRCNPAALASVLKVQKHGTLKQRLRADAGDDYLDFRDHMLGTVHGFSTSAKDRFEQSAKKHPSWVTTVHEDDAITGMMSYTMDLENEAMPVYSMHWTTPNARLNILDFLARHVDQIKQIRVPIMPGEQPHLWATDDGSFETVSNEKHGWNAPMGRIVDIAGLEGIDAGKGSVTMAVTDPQAPWNTGTWTFTGRDGSLQVEKGGEATSELSINGLSALVFNGMDLNLVASRGWGSVSEKDADNLRAMFPPAEPFLQELF